MEQKAYDLGKKMNEAKLFHDYLDKTKGRNLLESLILMTHEKNIDVRDVTVLTTKYLLGSYEPNYKHNDLLSKLFYDNMKGGK